jgi:hypothetical protein
VTWSVRRFARTAFPGFYMTGGLIVFKDQWIPVGLCALAGVAIPVATHLHHRR